MWNKLLVAVAAVIGALVLRSLAVGVNTDEGFTAPGLALTVLAVALFVLAAVLVVQAVAMGVRERRPH